MNRTDRLLGYLTMLQGRSLITARQMADYFEISERTVYRDIQALCEVGVPIASMPGEGYRLMSGYHLPPIAFTAEEARALHLALSLFSATALEGATHRASRSVQDKIRAVLPRADREKLELWETILHFFSFPNRRVDFDDSKFLVLQKSIEDCRLLRIRYHAESSNAVTEREIEPLELSYINQTWLVGGFCRLRQETRRFRLDRIDHLQECDETFSPRPMDNRRNEESSPARVRFHGEVVRWVRERQHFSFVGSEKCEGGQEMTYTMRDQRVLADWLLQWAGSFEVISPPSLRDEVRLRAEAVLDKHRT